jgi:membrane-bound ClpP family serine protease
VEGRPILIGILVAALVALAALGRLDEVRSSGFEWTPGIITVIVLILAVTGHGLAWGIAFALAAIGVGFEAVLTVAEPWEPARLAVTAVGGAVVLALWALKPPDEATPPTRP